MIGRVALAVSAGIAVFLMKSRWNYQRLAELPQGSGETPSDVTVIIPARNEAHQIQRAVSSFPGTPVLVVDDASSDGTADVARRAGAAVLNAPRLSGKALGKPNACAAGAAVARSAWLLFVDADTWYDTGFLPALLSHAEHNRLDAATVFLRQECETPAERVLLPYAFALYFCGVSAASVNRQGGGEALANGQCLLFRRSSYESIGGHTAVRDSVIEDVALAALAKRHNLRLQVMRGESLGHVRMYDGFPAIWRGFQKNSFRFLLVNPWSGMQVVAASILLTSYLPVLAALLLSGLWWQSAAFGLLPSALMTPWYGSFRRALAAPAAVYGFQMIALYGMASTLFGWSAVWKGRRV